MRLVEICVDGGLESSMQQAQAQLADAYLEDGRGLEARIISEDLVAREPWNTDNIDRFRRALVMLGETDPDAIIADRLSGDSPFLATDKLDLNEGVFFDDAPAGVRRPLRSRRHRPRRPRAAGRLRRGEAASAAGSEPPRRRARRARTRGARRRRADRPGDRRRRARAGQRAARARRPAGGAGCRARGDRGGALDDVLEQMREDEVGGIGRRSRRRAVRPRADLPRARHARRCDSGARSRRQLAAPAVRGGGAARRAASRTPRGRQGHLAGSSAPPKSPAPNATAGPRLCCTISPRRSRRPGSTPAPLRSSSSSKPKRAAIATWRTGSCGCRNSRPKGNSLCSDVCCSSPSCSRQVCS